jgi:hypothetical protein
MNIYKKISQSIANKRFQRIFLRAIGFFFLFIIMSFVGIFASYRFFNLSSSNAVLYVIRDTNGLVKFTDDMDFNKSGSLIFMLDASCFFSFVEGIASSAAGEPVVELTWDREQGKGVIKEIRPDGSKFLVVLSRYHENNGDPQGIFIGGDLPYGDVDRWKDRSRNNTGISFFDGHKWLHIWCSSNEGLIIKGIEKPVDPQQWTYLGSRVLKKKASEVMLQSMHEFRAFTAEAVPVNILMTRTLHKKTGDDYVTLKVQYINLSDLPLEFSYFYGDEPWVGEFGDSAGEVGWTEGKIYNKESYFLPPNHGFAGYWDIGNELAGEEHDFSGYADFIEWFSNPPALVFFSNSFSFENLRENKALDSRDNRIINLVWFSETLKSGESKTYDLALGMARPNPLTGLPVKPAVTGF